MFFDSAYKYKLLQRISLFKLGKNPMVLMMLSLCIFIKKEQDEVKSKKPRE